MIAKRLLIVEPALPLREALREEFVQRGWAVQATGSATTGLAIASWFRPTTVLLDLHESTVSIDSFVTLVRFGRSDRMFVVGMTTAHDAARAQRSSGVDEVITKPFEMADAFRAVDRLRGDANES